MPGGNSRLSKPVCKWFDHSPLHRAHERRKARRKVKRRVKRAAERSRAADTHFPRFPRTVQWDAEQTAHLRKRLSEVGGDWSGRA